MPDDYITVMSIAEAVKLIGREPSLAIGPSATCFPGVVSAVRRALVRRFPDLALPEDGTSFLDLGDVISSLHPGSLERFRQAVREELGRAKASPDLHFLATINWRACVSLTPDVHFEDKITTYRDQQPSSRTVTVLTAPSVSIPPRTTPIYKLFGLMTEASEERRLAYSQADFLFRQTNWPGLLSTLPDAIKDGALFFVGTDEVAAIAAHFLATLYAGPRPHPRTLVFLKTDGTPRLPAVNSVLRRAGVTAISVDGDLRELVHAVTALRPILRDKLGLARQASQVPWQLNHLIALSHIAERVPVARSLLENDSKVTHEIIDALFRPTGNDWRPYALALDLPRTASKAISDAIAEAESGHNQLVSVVLHGAAGTGKTTVLRRVAFDLAANGALVLWCNRSTSESTSASFRKLLRAAKDLPATERPPKRRLFVFIDDPWDLRISISDAISQLETAQIQTCLVVAFRTSDYVAVSPVGTPFPGVPTAMFELSHELDAAEKDALATFLIRIGACAREADSRALISRNPYARADDVLCSFWYLLPETRVTLQTSIEDEYLRLGDVRTVIEDAASSAASSSAVARMAYEAVTVASSLNIGLPVEVLVRALDVDYAEWLSFAQPGKPLWGLLYDEYEAEHESYVYRTRNEIVTKILLRLVNGGFGGHSGQYRLLKELIQACRVAAPPYRAFLHDVLVRSRDTLEKILSYEQGLDLYDSAAAAIPYPDRTLAHHRGIWIKNVGHDLAGAVVQLEKALNVPDQPGQTREEPREYIHTSLAATLLTQVRSGEIERSAGFERIMDHLERATNREYFNANQSHVMANTLYEMAQIGSQSTDTLRLGCLSAAMSEIERSLQLIGAPGKGAVRYQTALGYFEDLQRRVVETISEIRSLELTAEELFRDAKSQLGFEVWGRAELGKAIQDNSGTAYQRVSQLLTRIFSLIETAGLAPSPELRAIRVDLIVRWRVQQVRGAIDWKAFLGDLEQLARAPRYRDDVIKQFYYAVALYHVGRITEAHAIFASLRREQKMPSAHSLRCFLVGSEGFAKRLQATSVGRQGRKYVSIPSLGDDVPVQGPLDASPGGTIHVYMGFTGNGPVAIMRSPGPGDMLMPA